MPTDLVHRLRDRSYASKFPDPLVEEAADEIERLKQRAAELAYSKEQLEIRVLDLIMTRAKNAMVTLTDAEREAIKSAESDYSDNDMDAGCWQIAATLRGLLERTNHDAVPEAKADLPDERPPNAVSANGGTPGAASRDGSGTGNTQEPVAWAVVSDSKEEIDCEFVYPDRETAGDVALDINGGVVPLYRSPTLTDEERKAVEWFAAYGAGDHAATLRGLLERTK